MTKERRKHERRSSCMPVWMCDCRTGLRYQGHVMNISAGGAYVLAVAEMGIPVGKTVEITIGTHSDDHGGFELHCCEHNAKVVRSEVLGYATGFALEFVGQMHAMKPQRHMMLC